MAAPQKENNTSTTQSGIAQGALVVRNDPDPDLSKLNRDQTTLDGNGVKNSFDPQKVAQNQELGQVAGQVGMRAAGDIAGYMANNAATDQERAAWSDGGTNKVILHGLVGAATAALGNGNVAQGAAGAVTGEALSGVMQDYLVKQGVDPNSPTGKTLMEAGIVAVGAAGAASALNGELYNRQLHPDEIKWLDAIAKEFAAQLYGCSDACTPDQIQAAKNRLIVEAAARVDGVMTERVGGTDDAAQSFINTHPVNFAWGEGFSATREQYNDFKAFADLLANDKQAFSDLATALGDAGWTQRDFQNAYYDQLLTVASSSRGEDGVAMMEMFTGDVGMAAGIVRKLAKGDTKGASLDAVLAAMPFGAAKVVRAAVGKVGAKVGAVGSGAENAALTHLYKLWADTPNRSDTSATE